MEKLRSVLENLLERPILPALLGVACLLAISSCVLYFRVIQPRRGTTEWMQRVNRPRFRPLTLQPVGWLDGAWALLSIACGGIFRFVYLFFWMRLYLRPNLLQILFSAKDFFLMRLGLAALLALALYLLLRLLLGKSLPAFCAASLSGLMMNEYSDTLILLTLSLLCLYLWTCADYTAPLFFNGFWLLFSGLLYAVALFTCWELLWFGPFYLLVYLVVQILRFRGGEEEERVGKLVCSLLLVSVALIFGSLLLWIAFCVINGTFTVYQLPELGTAAFYQEMFRSISYKLRAMLQQNRSLFRGVLVRDAFLFLAGSAAWIPMVHSLILQKDSRVFFLLGLLVVGLCMWIFSGVYLLCLPLLLCAAWLWGRFSERGAPGLCLLYGGALGLFYVLTI